MNYHKALLGSWIENETDWVQSSRLSPWLTFGRGVPKDLGILKCLGIPDGLDGADEVDKNAENNDDDKKIDDFFQNDIQYFLKFFWIFFQNNNFLWFFHFDYNDIFEIEW